MIYGASEYGGNAAVAWVAFGNSQQWKYLAVAAHDVKGIGADAKNCCCFVLHGVIGKLADLLVYCLVKQFSCLYCMKLFELQGHTCSDAYRLLKVCAAVRGVIMKCKVRPIRLSLLALHTMLLLFHTSRI